jgi:hypothetical protein
VMTCYIKIQIKTKKLMRISGNEFLEVTGSETEHDLIFFYKNVIMLSVEVLLQMILYCLFYLFYAGLTTE